MRPLGEPRTCGLPQVVRGYHLRSEVKCATLWQTKGAIDMRQRATQHSGRFSKATGAVYGTSHNDRTFEGKADNIDETRTAQNVTWTWNGAATFEDAERAYYEQTFGETLESNNEAYRAKGKLSQVKSMDEWRKSKAHCPEEVILQIGKVEGHADPETFKACVADYVNHLKQMDALQILDYAIHLDEAVPHCHIRRVWLAEDSHGRPTTGQNKALLSMGYERPDKAQPNSRFNNPKMTFDAHMRNIWLDICESHGLSVERVPDPTSRHNRTKERMIQDKLSTDLQNRAEIEERERQLAERELACDAREESIADDELIALRTSQSLSERKKELTERESAFEAKKASEDAQRASERAETERLLAEAQELNWEAQDNLDRNPDAETMKNRIAELEQVEQSQRAELRRLREESKALPVLRKLAKPFKALLPLLTKIQDFEDCLKYPDSHDRRIKYPKIHQMLKQATADPFTPTDHAYTEENPDGSTQYYWDSSNGNRNSMLTRGYMPLVKELRNSELANYSQELLDSDVFSEATEAYTEQRQMEQSQSRGRSR